MQQQSPLMNLFFCNPGEYQVNVSLNIQYRSAGNQYDYPKIGMPQQQLPALEYGDANARQFGNNGYVPFGNSNNTCGFPRPDSSSSILESSYSSGLSTPGIASNSWSYNSPHQVYPCHRNGQQFNNARWNGSHIPYSFSSGDSINNGFNPANKSCEFPTTSTPTKRGCFSVKNCTII